MSEIQKRVRNIRVRKQNECFQLTYIHDCNFKNPRKLTGGEDGTVNRGFILDPHKIFREFNLAPNYSPYLTEKQVQV